MDNMVQITKAEFESLLKARFDIEMVKDVLLNRAKADWSGKYLTWSDETTSAVLRHIMGDAYDKKLEELNSKVEELNKEDGE
ncbi:hypothetical protein [uncultured Senegalimassilia sp.]|uniref:hypothetical protein n=1 Tax=uncultured Senegalimassilia sp. TaxID=1714350 RepID=UPI00260CE060|nr:hypothetical protein [uncultured Senegalimassilia sp.]